MNITSLLILAVNCILVENIVLVRLLGVSPFVEVSKKKGTIVGVGLSVSVVMLISTLFSWCINQFVFKPFHLEYLQIVVFVLMLVLLVQAIEILLKKFVPVLYKLFGSYLPLMVMNCAILGVVLGNVRNEYGLLESLVASVASAVGFVLVYWMFSCIRERLVYCVVPKSFEGLPITLITMGLLSLAFMGFSGMGL